jgi:transcriptional regulator of aromatic amino acid metabolism
MRLASSSVHLGDLPLTLKPKILRVLQEKEFERVGGEKTLKVDVRLIAAINLFTARIPVALEWQLDFSG